MKKPVEQYSDAVFLVTAERSCPVYNVGEELKVQDFCLSVTSYKPGCLHLAKKIASILTVKDNITGGLQAYDPKSQFDCGGCEGIIHFEYKKDKDFATLQMKMLKTSEDRRHRHLIEQYFGELRKLDIFKPLNDLSLVDLTLLLEFQTIPRGKRVVKKGAPGNHLYVILKGKVAVINDDGSTKVEIPAGEIFGEMSLLSGEPVSKSIHTVEDTLVGMLSLKNFRDILRSYHKLQFFLLKMLVNRAQTVALRTGNISSGMTGKLAEINAADVFKLLNSNQKTGAVRLALKEGKAVLFFKKGEIIYARFQKHRQREAVYALLGAKDGHFSYTRGIPKELEKSSPIGEFITLITEGMKRVNITHD